MKLTVIGFWGAYPSMNEATSAYLVETEDTKVLLDCGSGSVARLQQHIDLKQLDACILTHYHHDHIADIGVLQYSRVVDMNLKRTNKPLQIYGHIEDEKSFQALGKKPYTEVYTYNANQELKVGSLAMTFHKTTHPAPCYAVKVVSEKGSNFVYTGDTSYDETIVPFIRGTDLLITECSFYKGEEASAYGHMNSEEAATLAKKARVKQLLLSHLPHFGKHNQLLDQAKEIFEGKVELASSNWKWDS